MARIHAVAAVALPIAIVSSRLLTPLHLLSLPAPTTLRLNGLIRFQIGEFIGAVFWQANATASLMAAQAQQVNAQVGTAETINAARDFVATVGLVGAVLLIVLYILAMVIQRGVLPAFERMTENNRTLAEANERLLKRLEDGDKKEGILQQWVEESKTKISELQSAQAEQKKAFDEQIEQLEKERQHEKTEWARRDLAIAERHRAELTELKRQNHLLIEERNAALQARDAAIAARDTALSLVEQKDDTIADRNRTIRTLNEKVEGLEKQIVGLASRVHELEHPPAPPPDSPTVAVSQSPDTPSMASPVEVNGTSVDTVALDTHPPAA